MARHERFLAWQRVHQLTLAVYEATRTWPPAERYGLTGQARRAASSAGANIAEGAARLGPREFKRYLDIAIGSLGELDNHLRLALDLGLLSREKWQELTDLQSNAMGLVVLLARSMRKAGAARLSST
jgi:four helix bundle protein